MTLFQKIIFFSKGGASVLMAPDELKLPLITMPQVISENVNILNLSSNLTLLNTRTLDYYLVEFI